jgi:hypothetical protein
MDGKENQIPGWKQENWLARKAQKKGFEMRHKILGN